MGPLLLLCLSTLVPHCRRYSCSWVDSVPHLQRLLHPPQCLARPIALLDLLRASSLPRRCAVTLPRRLCRVGAGTPVILRVSARGGSLHHHLPLALLDLLASMSRSTPTSQQRPRQLAWPITTSSSHGQTTSSDSDVPRRSRRTDRSAAHAASLAAAVSFRLRSAFGCFRAGVLADRRCDIETSLAAVPRASWLCRLYVCRWRAHVRRSDLAARCAAILSPPLHVRYVRKLRRLATHRRHVLGLLAMRPRPLYAYDVGYDANSGVFSFRDPCGRLSTQHPAAASASHTIPAYSPDGSIVPALSPPPSSSYVLCAEASGAWCYYDTATGDASWYPPADSTPLQSRLLRTDAVPFGCLLYTSPSPRDYAASRMPSSA